LFKISQEEFPGRQPDEHNGDQLGPDPGEVGVGWLELVRKGFAP